MYARGTEVPVERSRSEIERMVKKYGADGFGYFEVDGFYKVAFKARGRNILFVVKMPAYEDHEYAGKRRRAQCAIQDAVRAEERRLFRSLLLSIKAKLEAVESGIASFEDEFLANIVMPDGRTVGESVSPLIEESYASGRSIPLLGSGK